MELNDEQHAVLSEQMALQIKIDKLEKIVCTPLDGADKNYEHRILLAQQLIYMRGYNRVLIERISMF